MDKIEVGEIFTITDETEEEQTVEVIAIVTLDEIDYIAVSFLEDLQDGHEDDIDIFFLKVDNDGDLDAIDNDEEFEKVSKAFDDILAEENEE
ncbi:DUF1292 domain-containing protein [Aquibacillus salsiterrae]|uniref:DUF1292 domain-containing protein n=1 Tax=Aquibacillus salsiterrae TaxID=2950439 RepID=A0A9X3WD54_9BACI|nr:DUF1292 domain-containing protein [Aquibacillus salsiterrae]MDC3417417.1 DUF1292 domain-containing protein [Aquibacillus salsiterrae]